MYVPCRVASSSHTSSNTLGSVVSESVPCLVFVRLYQTLRITELLSLIPLEVSVKLGSVLGGNFDLDFIGNRSKLYGASVEESTGLADGLDAKVFNL